MEQLAFLQFGTFWFWFVAAIVFILSVWNLKVEDSVGGLAYFMVIVFTLIISAANYWFMWFASNFIAFLLYFFIYSLAGALWSLIKWYLFLLDKRPDFYEATVKITADTERRWSEHGKLKDSYVNPDLIDECNKEITKYIEEHTPQARYYKAKIISWMMLWPFSLSEEIFTRLLKRFFIGLFNLLRRLYQKITDKVLSPDKFTTNYK